MTQHRNGRTPREVTAEEAVGLLQSGTNVFLHGACASPIVLEAAMCQRTDLKDVTLYHIHKNGPAPFVEPAHQGRFRSTSLFMGSNVRQAVDEGRADFVPIFLSDIPWLFRSGQVPLHAAVVQLSEPDRHGFCTLGPSVDTALAAVEAADIVLAEINKQMPRVHGNSFVHLSKIDAFVRTDRPLCTASHGHPGPAEEAIGGIIADLVADGSTLQMGIGGIPDAVLARLTNKSDLGIHTEMFSDGLVPLVESGVVNCRKKSVHPGRIVTSFVNGTQRVLDFIHDNPMVEFHPCDYTNDTALIRRHDRMMAINSAIEVDLTGQVCADSMGFRMYSGIGGQMDFIRGAALAREGKAIIALPATAKKGTLSRIVPTLKPGAGVVTSRGHVHWVVTEFGAVNLHGLPLQKRAEALLSIAHPDFRAELKASLKEQRSFVVA